MGVPRTVPATPAQRPIRERGEETLLPEFESWLQTWKLEGDKLLNLSKPQIPHLQKGDNNGVSLVMVETTQDNPLL